MISNPFIRIENELNKIDDILEKKLKNYPDARADIHQKLEEKNIKIMFFGAYNAGKSTLINSILKEDKAKIGDIPTTDTVDTYLWNDYKLLDTPGINAPIEHEAISKEQLEKSDLVVFVIRKDDEDASSTYREIFDLLKKEKDIFLVFNYSGLDKNGVGEGSVQLSINRLNHIMLSKATEYGIEDSLLEKIELIPINLKTALKARLEDKEKLLEHSNYNEFEERFTLWLSQYNSEHQILKTLKRQIDNQLLLPVINSIEKNHTKLDGRIEGLELLNAQKENLKMDIEIFVQDKISTLLPKVIALLEDGETESVKNELSEVYRAIELYLSEILKESILTIEKESLKLQNNEISSVPSSKGIEFDPKVLLPLIATIPLPPQIKLIVTAVLNIATTLFGSDDGETERENERQRAKALQISQVTQDIRNKILTSILKQSKELIEKSFQTSIDEIEKDIKKEKENLNREENIKTLLNEARVKINSINF
jgi:small GTP-binding protein